MKSLRFDKSFFYKNRYIIGYSLLALVFSFILLFASLNFQNGFTNVLKKESETLRSLSKNQTFLQNAKSNFFQINIGILF